MATSKKIILKSSDGETFEVDEAVAMKSLTIKHMIEDDCANEAIPLDNVTGAILAKVIEYLKKHIDDADPNNKDESLMKWDEEFVKVDQPTLFSLIMAANFLHISELLDLTCNAVADMMRGKTPEQVRAIFNIKNDYTTKEEAEVREENKWAFE